MMQMLQFQEERLFGAANMVKGLEYCIDMRFWVVMLLVQSLPYLAALIMAFMSSLPKPVEAPEQHPTT